MTMEGDFTVALPRYRSHKIVGAAKIKAIDFADSDVARLDLMPHGVIVVGADWIKEKRAEVGGYFVKYEDGYTSYSPAKAFEEGYVELEQKTRGIVPTGNPNHPMTRAMENQWHKIVAILLERAETPKVNIPPGELTEIMERIEGKGVVIRIGDARGIDLTLVGGAEADRLAREEGGLPT